MAIHRFSSRRHPLDSTFLNDRLKGATQYDRIAGYFSSSILEVAGEALETVDGVVRIVCNSDLDSRDVAIAQDAATCHTNTAANQAMRREWCAFRPEEKASQGRNRFHRLHQFLSKGKLEVRVIPKERFGLVHGKAGVITSQTGERTAFMGSTNETWNAWKLNYELVWEDSSEEAVAWVEEEFQALWNSPWAIPLAEAVVEDVGRCARRTVVGSVEIWRDAPDPASALVEAPVYRREDGLWEHQKYFVKKAFDAHRTVHGARFVLADMVGLGKTVQLGMAALLMALYGNKPVLVIAPPTLLIQWQQELKNLLNAPSARWTAEGWVDEHEVLHPVLGPEGVRKCPRRIGLFSQGLITRRNEAAEILATMDFECVVVDEAHRARRNNRGWQLQGQKPVPNHLLEFLFRISKRTHSFLLATATPVQLYPVEGWDLLNALCIDSDRVLGNITSQWRKAEQALSVVAGTSALPEDDLDFWDWLRNPMPPAEEDEQHFGRLRRSLGMRDEDLVAPGSGWLDLPQPDQARVRRIRPKFASDHNPFIRHIIRRTREFLETTINPETKEPYLQPVEVQLFGENPEEAIPLPAYLRSAYEIAEAFCRSIAARALGGLLLRTQLLRRMGSTMEAGRRTAEKMRSEWGAAAVEDSEEEEPPEDASTAMKELTTKERSLLQNLVEALDANQERDPKYMVVEELLRFGYKPAATGSWLTAGCIVFSQYYDSIRWLAARLSADRFPDEPIGIYAGGGRSGIWLNGEFQRQDRDELKQMVRNSELRLLLGTEAASEGLNLQKLGSLINLDLPWNPTRLEQRKGRIQRIGQARQTVFVYNMRYRDSIEDRVHELLASRLQDIHRLFGQIPDVLEEVWIKVALGELEAAKSRLDAIPTKHPFELKYNRIEQTDWESCAKVLDAKCISEALQNPW